MSHLNGDSAAFPEGTKNALCPSPDLPVFEFCRLVTPKPFRPNVVQIISQAGSEKVLVTRFTFLTDPPNEHPGYVTQLTLSEPNACTYVLDGIAKALQEGWQWVIYLY
jgi:hypothetical protein